MPLRITLGGAVLAAVVGCLPLVIGLTHWGDFDSIHRTVAAFTALLAGIVGTRAGRDVDRRVRSYLTAAIACWATAQLLLDVSLVAGGGFVDTLAHAMLLLTGVSGTAALWVSIRGLEPARRRTTALDAITVFLATAATMMALLSVLAPGVATTDRAFALAYPVMLAAMTAGAVVCAVALRIEVAPRGADAVIAGSGLMSIAWLGRLVSPGAANDPLFDALFSVALILVGFGTATWTTRRMTDPAALRLAERLSAALPLAATMLMAFIVATRGFAGDPLGLPILLTAGLALVATAVRQWWLLRERGGMVRELAAAEGELRHMLDDRTVAESRQRHRAGLLSSVLDASEGLVAGHEASTYTRVLELITPPGAQGTIAIDDEATGDAVIVAAAGSNADRLVGCRVDYRMFSEEIQDIFRHREPRAAVLGGEDPDAIAAGIPADLIAPAGTGRLIVPLLRPGGGKCGALVVVDPEAERIADPIFLDLARLVANQLSVAIENNRLVGELEARLDETRRMQVGLVRASKMAAIGQLAGAVAHEVNNPLTGILGYAELVLAGLPADDPSHHDIEVIRSEALRARGIVRALMDFAQSRVAERVETDLNELTRSTVGLMRYHLMRGGIVMTESYGELPLIECDPAAIGQAIVNLCNNAVEAMGRGGTIFVETSRGIGSVRVRIRDSGAGMTDAVKARMFEPFFTTRVQSGGGLGLPVALSIVESHGGSITVESTPGRGTVVEMTLPMTVVAAPRSARRSAVAPAAAPAVATAAIH